jgi:uncharacterized protein
MRLGMTLEIATSLGAICGGLTAGWLHPSALQILFAVALLPTAVLMWRGVTETAQSTRADTSEQLTTDHRPLTTSASDPRPLTTEHCSLTTSLAGRYFDPQLGRMVVYQVQRLWAGLGISFIAGNLSGLLGIGGGVFKVPALHLACQVPIKAAAATSNFMIGVTAATSAFLYYGRGEVRPALTGGVVVGVIVGSAIGSWVSAYLQGRLIKRLFSILLICMAVQMLIRVFW